MLIARQHHDLIDIAFQTRDSFGRRRRDGDDDARGAGAADVAQGGEHGQAGGDAVIDHDRGFAGQRRHRPAAEIDLPPSPRLLALALYLRPEPVRIDPLDFAGIGRQFAALGDRGNGVFRLPGMPDLARDDQIEREVEGLRNLGAEHHPAAWQSDHDRLGLFVRGQRGGQATAGIRSIPESHGQPREIFCKQATWHHPPTP